MAVHYFQTWDQLLTMYCCFKAVRKIIFHLYQAKTTSIIYQRKTPKFSRDFQHFRSVVFLHSLNYIENFLKFTFLKVVTSSSELQVEFVHLVENPSVYIAARRNVLESRNSCTYLIWLVNYYIVWEADKKMFIVFGLNDLQQARLTLCWPRHLEWLLQIGFTDLLILM